MAKKTPKSGDFMQRMKQVVDESTDETQRGVVLERGGPRVEKIIWEGRPGYGPFTEFTDQDQASPKTKAAAE